MSAEDVHVPSPSPESSGLQPELLPGASPETAVLLTPEQLATFRGKAFYVATEVDETLVKQAREVVAASETQPDLSLWVRAEEPKAIDGFDTLFNTWKLNVDERTIDFGRPASNKYYMTHQDDGRVEFVYEMRPIR
jgi:hypothetical protein